MNAARTLGAVAGCLDPVSLGEVTAVADLRTRVDRKYVVTPAVLETLVGGFPGLFVLDIDGERVFGYESVYFDTPGLASFRGSVGGRRHRFKVRTRCYEGTGTCALEVKRQGGRGETVKDRMPYRLEDRRRLTGSGRAFVAERITPPQQAQVLEPTLVTRYRRITLVDVVGRWRMTVDDGLECSRIDGANLSLTARVVVETKSAGAPTPVDRALWALGHRPVAFSKYGIGMAGLDPSLPAHRWGRALRRHFDVRPDRIAA